MDMETRRQARRCFQETPPDLHTVCRAAEIWTRDLRSPRSMHPEPLTCVNAWKPPLACSPDWSLVRTGSRCFATSRGLYAAWRKALLEGHSDGGCSSSSGRPGEHSPLVHPRAV